ncbi:hypothetical protein LWI29_037359 [Acer saccharum]|uniref:Uncharacterized protein n=1 Tax=Acer saccharum TaxID=4024 RepID=A0AA39TK78_ACESA|nr:hypothetical protein LWI29_037359 [Acer saccharum]
MGSCSTKDEIHLISIFEGKSPWDFALEGDSRGKLPVRKGKDDAVVDGFADGVIGKATENAKGLSTIAIGGKDNEKSTNGVPSITEGKVGAIDDDYHKKLHFQSTTGQPKVPHSTKKHGIKDNKQAPHANKKEDTVLPKAIKKCER